MAKHTQQSSRAKQKAATAERILIAARSEFEAEGYHSATIRGIASAAGMSTGAVFANYTDKAALYAAVYGHKPITPEEGRAILRRLTSLSATPEHQGA